MKDEHSQNAAMGHPIAVVSRKTGLSPDVLRVWERRYRAVTPFRKENGRRVYSDNDLSRLALLREVTWGGRRIGDVAELTLAQLEALAAEDRAQRPSPVSIPAGDRSTRLLREALSAVERMDAAELRSVLSRTLVLLRVSELVEEVVGPLLHEIGERWRSGALTPVQERVATNVIRQVLTEAVGHLRAEPRSRCVVVATPEGQLCDLGALLAALVVASGGWRVVFLGPNIPTSDIVRATVQAAAEVVALSIVVADEDGRLARDLRGLRSALPPHVRLIVGGRGSFEHADTLREIGAIHLTDTRRLVEVLDQQRTPRGGERA